MKFSLDDPRFGNKAPSFVVHEGEMWLLINGYKRLLNNEEFLESTKHGIYRMRFAEYNYGILEHLDSDNHWNHVFIGPGKKVTIGRDPRKVTAAIPEELMAAVLIHVDTSIRGVAKELLHCQYRKLHSILYALNRNEIPLREQEHWDSRVGSLRIRIAYALQCTEEEKPIPLDCEFDKLTSDVEAFEYFHLQLAVSRKLKR